MGDLIKIENELVSFIWVTKEGYYLRLDEMKTSHIFNSMKMQFNHLASQYGLPTVWFKNLHPGKIRDAIEIPELVFRDVIIFICEIERRGDLPGKYKDPYNQIIDILKQIKYGNDDKYLEYIKALPEKERCCLDEK